jgi:dCTP deaminase
MHTLFNKRRGALPSQHIRSLLDAGFIVGANPDNIRPASLDLSLSDELYAVKGIFQPRHNETVREVLTHIFKRRHSFNSPLVPGNTYFARLNETISLPKTVYGYCNPKSTTGRNDIHARVLADRVPRYDAVSPAGWQGELWIAISPRSYPVILSPGATLSQLRFFTADTRFDELELEIEMARHKLLWQPNGTPIGYRDITFGDNDGSLIVTLDVESPVIGYEYRGNNGPIDLTKDGAFLWRDYFKPVKPKDGVVHLEKEHFYILSTHEAVRVPPELALELAPMDERSGEFRSHYAGFIDPGFGWGLTGERKGNQLTLEVRPFEDLIIRRGQPIAKMRYERMIEAPDMLYESFTTSHYTEQRGARLAKQFAM